jgi:hypothetical protein
MTFPSLRMQYLVPSGFPAPDGKLDKAAIDLGASLRNVDKKWTPVPNSALLLKLIVMLDGSSLEIKKRDQLVYINLFNFEARTASSVLLVVHGLYEKYNLGIPPQPKVESWIHSIPVSYESLRPNEISLCEKLTVSFFWGVYGQHWKRANPLN